MVVVVTAAVAAGASGTRRTIIIHKAAKAPTTTEDHVAAAAAAAAGKRLTTMLRLDVILWCAFNHMIYLSERMELSRENEGFSSSIDLCILGVLRCRVTTASWISG